MATQLSKTIAVLKKEPKEEHSSEPKGKTQLQKTIEKLKGKSW